MRVLAEAVGSISQPQQIRAASYGRAGQISIEQITNLLDQIHSATRDAEKLVQGRSNADLTTRLELGSWSVAECLDHLAQTTRAFLPAILDAVATAPKLTTRRPLRTGTMARLFIRNLEPPYRIRFKVLAQIAPQEQDFEAAWKGFLESQSELLSTVHSAAGLAIDRVKIKSPVYARISYNVYGALRILATHQRRHLWQAKGILKELDQERALQHSA